MIISKKTVAPVAWKIAGVRTYASGAGLSKEDVEGRIIGLLAGFDKVRFACVYCPGPCAWVHIAAEY